MVGHEIWQEAMKNVQNEKHTLQDLEYGEKHLKTWKMTNAHCRNLNIYRKQTNEENEKIMVVPGIWRED